MSTALDRRMAQTVPRLVNKFGTDVTIIKRSYTGWDDVKNEATSSLEGDLAFTIKATPPKRYNVKEIDDLHILREDIQILIAGEHSELTAYEYREIETGNELRELTTEEFRQLVSETTINSLLPPDTERDLIMFKDERYKVVTASPVYSGDDVAAYKIQLRK